MVKLLYLIKLKEIFSMVGTFWEFMPAIIAIVLALVTKQVYVSLFAGIFVGAMMYVGGNPVSAMQTVYELMSERLAQTFRLSFSSLFSEYS